jgi:hypothetical protein
MNAATELRRNIETCELPHPAFLEHHKALQRRIEDALAGYAPRLDWVVGPSRVGKSMLLNALARDYPATKVDGGRRVPVLTVPISPSISPMLLPMSVLTALGVPLPQRGITSGIMFNRMADQLKLARTQVLLFEEASHLVEPGARLPPRAAGDWFKSVLETLDMTVILFGVPRLERLFASNEQLRLRASARREFRPYNFQSIDEQRAFASCVRTYSGLFSQSGWPIEVPHDVLVRHCYLLCGGLVGVLSRFMQELACQMAYEAPRGLTFADCAATVQLIEGAGHPHCPPFFQETVSAIELNQAHAHVLEISEMPMRKVLS